MKIKFPLINLNIIHLQVPQGITFIDTYELYTLFGTRLERAYFVMQYIKFPTALFAVY
jgi:hypothetical protein